MKEKKRERERVSIEVRIGNRSIQFRQISLERILLRSLQMAHRMCELYNLRFLLHVSVTENRKLNSSVGHRITPVFVQSASRPATFQ